MKKAPSTPKAPISQKALAAYLQLSPSTVSLVLNNAPLAAAIPEQTRLRVLEAAKRFDYRPDLYAKYLYSKRSYTVAVLLPEVGQGFSAAILGGIDDALVREKFFYFVANHHSDEELIREYPRQLTQRGVEGFIVINTPIHHPLGRPTVSIGNQPLVDGMARIMLDNRRGGWLAAEHLIESGHRQIAVIKGHAWRPASSERWRGISSAAKSRGITIDPRLVKQLPSKGKAHEPSTAEEGYFCTRELLNKKVHFTALIAFNDFSAIGAIRAFHEAGVRVPQDVSVVGFDDIQGAAYQIPGLTTLRQPLSHMGELAGSRLLKMISGEDTDAPDMMVEPELIIRESTRPLVPPRDLTIRKMMNSHSSL
ncbi:MAG TPA: LacI family DNA-binding transcriptional regulator [Acidisarcina sp.]|nr:LacI family DNA-binding transcriptional regulator [Acidisarcina sp.]